VSVKQFNVEFVALPVRGLTQNGIPNNESYFLCLSNSIKMDEKYEKLYNNVD
jgi:hypothetical protein